MKLLGYSISSLFLLNTALLAQPVPAHSPKRLAEFHNGLAAATIQGKVGFLNQTGQFVVEPAYDVVFPFTEGLAAVRKGDKMGYLDRTGKISIPLIYDGAAPFSEGLASVRQGDKWGFIDPKGRWVIPPRFYAAMHFNEGTAYAAQTSPTGSVNWGLIDRAGNVLEPFKYPAFQVQEYDNAYFQSADALFVAFTASGSLKGHELSPVPASVPLLAEASEKNTPTAPLAVSSPTIVYDSSGQGVKQDDHIILPAQYEEIEQQGEGGRLFQVKKDGKYGYYWATGQPLTPPISEKPSFFKEGKVPVRVSGKWGFLDSLGRVVVPYQYEMALPFADGLAIVQRAGKWGFIDHAGQEVIPIIHDAYVLDGSSERPRPLFAIKKENKIGLYDRTGKLVVPFQYEAIGAWREGLLCVQQPDTKRWGFIDRRGAVVLAFQFAQQSEFRNGKAVVLDADTQKTGLIDKTGRAILPFRYDGLEDDFKWGLMAFKQGDKWGYLNRKGEVVIAATYQSAGSFSWRRAYVSTPERSFWINLLGKCVRNCPN